VPRSVFLGRPWPQPGEPLWLDEDRHWALALLEIEADSCRDCGQPWSEATDPDAEFRYHGAVVRCHACATAARTVSAFEKSGGQTEGLHVHVERR
jgi:hypothetical protein